MDIIASIVAYFGTVAAIVLGLAVSYDALVQAPLHSAAAPHALVVSTQPNAAKAAAKPIPAARQQTTAARNVARGVAERTAAPPRRETRSKAERVRNALLRKQYEGRPTQQARTQEWAAEEPSRVSGYADEPRDVFGYAPFQ